MYAAQFVAALANHLGKSVTPISTLDRAMADAGVRAKAVGRRVSDITTKEAVHLLLGIMGGRPAIHAAENALDLANSTIATGQSEDALKAFHYAFGIENDFSELCKKPLGDLLVLLCRRLADGKLGQDNFLFLEIIDGAIAKLQIELNWQPTDRGQKLNLYGTVSFSGLVSVPVDGSRGKYYETRTASWSLLQWIGENTASAND